MSELESCPTCGALPCDQVLALRSNPQPGSEGWRLVPVELTPDMRMSAILSGAVENESGVSSFFPGKAWSAMLAASPTPPTAQPGEVERLRSALHGRLWVAYGDGMIGLPSGFHLGSGGEYGDYHYRWRADEGVEYVVFEGGCVWFCAVAIEGRIDTWWQAKSREDAKMSAYRDAGAKDILAALTPSESQEAGNV